MKSGLIIVPYENVYPPQNGGMQRCFHIIHQLAKSCHLSLIIFQDRESFLQSAKEYPAIENIKIYSTKNEQAAKDIFSILPKRVAKALRYRWLRKKITGSTDGMFLEYYPVLSRVVKQQKFDFVILENLLTLHAVSVIRKYDPSVSIIYDAHNVDSILVEEGVDKYTMDAGYLKKVQKTEGALHKKVNAILACSEHNRIQFLEMNDHKVTTVVIPNGVSIGRMYDEGVKQVLPEYILFCGALWTLPNSEGLFWFYKNIWPRIKSIFPLLKLLIVGSGQLPPRYDELYKDTSLVFTGSVEDVKPWYNKASIAIVPLLSGSGTRLKILEAMSLGLPVISTTKGAEGINYTNGHNIIICDKDVDFSNNIISLLKNKTRRLEIQQCARKLVESRYDWDVIGKSLTSFLMN